MITPFKNDVIGLIWLAFQNLYPDKVDSVECNWMPDLKDEEGNEVYGMTIFGEDGIAHVYVNPSLSTENVGEIFAHELAHVGAGIEAEHGEEWELTFVGIFNEYVRIAHAELGLKEKTNDKKENEHEAE